ncbi:hypothetical protein COBT_002903 [Conglomerata obtusa]
MHKKRSKINIGEVDNKKIKVAGDKIMSKTKKTFNLDKPNDFNIKNSVNYEKNVKIDQVKNIKHIKDEKDPFGIENALGKIVNNDDNIMDTVCDDDHDIINTNLYLNRNKNNHSKDEVYIDEYKTDMDLDKVDVTSIIDVRKNQLQNVSNVDNINFSNDIINEIDFQDALDQDLKADDKYVSFLENTSTKELIIEFKNLDVSIKDFIKNLPPLTQKNLKKLYVITNSIEMVDLVDLTKEKDRIVRFISTCCCCSKMKFLLFKLKVNNKFEKEINFLFDNVFLSRYRDIDPNIRAVCIETLSEIILSDVRFKKKTYLNYIGNSLIDKNENVRKKSLKASLNFIERISNSKDVHKLRSKKNKTKNENYFELNGFKNNTTKNQDNNDKFNEENCLNNDEHNNYDAINNMKTSLNHNNSNLANVNQQVKAITDKNEEQEKELRDFLLVSKKKYVQIAQLDKNERNRKDASLLLVKMHKLNLCKINEFDNILKDFEIEEINYIFNDFKTEYGLISAIDHLYNCSANCLNKISLTLEEVKNYIELLINETDDDKLDKETTNGHLEDQQDLYVTNNKKNASFESFLHEDDYSKFANIKNNLNINGINNIKNESKNDYLNKIPRENEKFIDYFRKLKLMIKEDHEIIFELFTLMKKYKENKSILDLLVQSLITIHNELFDIKHEDLIEMVIMIIKTNAFTSLIGNCFLFLKKVEKIFESKITFFIENLKLSCDEDLKLHAIRCFDFSNCITKRSCTEAQILAAFWKLNNFNFSAIEELTININDLNDFEASTNYLIYCNEAVTNYQILNEKYTYCYDPISGIKIIYDRLKDCVITFIDNSIFNEGKENIDDISNNSDFMQSNHKNYNKSADLINSNQYLKDYNRKKNHCNKEEIMNQEINTKGNKYKQKVFDIKKELSELKNKTKTNFTKNFIRIVHIINSHFELIFQAGNKDIEETLITIKNHDTEIIDGFFYYITKNNNIDYIKIKYVTQILVKKIKNIKIFDSMKRLITNENLYDNCFVYFVKFLKPEECIELEKDIKIKCKFKNALVKKIGKENVNEKIIYRF